MAIYHLPRAATALTLCLAAKPSLRGVAGHPRCRPTRRRNEPSVCASHHVSSPHAHGSLRPGGTDDDLGRLGLQDHRWLRQPCHGQGPKPRHRCLRQWSPSRAFLRMDGNASGIGDFAITKAEAVANWHFSTAQMAVSAKETPGFADAPHVVTVPGGLPVFSADGRFLGAVGVSGEAPGDDADCADAGIKAADYSSSRPAAAS